MCIRCVGITHRSKKKNRQVSRLSGIDGCGSFASREDSSRHGIGTPNFLRGKPLGLNYSATARGGASTFFSPFFKTMRRFGERMLRPLRHLSQHIDTSRLRTRLVQDTKIPPASHHTFRGNCLMAPLILDFKTLVGPWTVPLSYWAL